MKRWIYYHWLAVSDLFRLWTTTQHHVIIVAGICLPILLLLGLKQGHVAELRKDLLTSPTGRQVVFWSAQQGELMDSSAVARLEHDLPRVDLIIPELQRVVNLSAEPGRGEKKFAENVTLYATRPGDPVLARAGGDVLLPGEPALVLVDSVARALEVRAGDSITLTVLRQRADGSKEPASTPMRVKTVLSAGPGESRIAYAEAGLLDRIEQYVRGYRVEEFGWAAKKESAPDTYSSYLVFCERTNDLTRQDRESLEGSGYMIEALAPGQLPALRHLLAAERADDLRIYRIFTAESQTNPRRRLTRSPSEFSQLTDADDVVLPWNEPREIEAIGDQSKCVLVGLTLPKRSWLRTYFRDPALAFDYEAREFSYRADNRRRAGDLRLPGKRGGVITLQPAGEANAPPPVAGENGSGPDVIAVPVNLLAHLDAMESGHCEYDPDSRLFTRRAERPVYDKARLYVKEIDDVPAVVNALQKRHFAVMSENARITEIQHQNHSLQLLVWIVGVGVFLFGVLVVVSVLLDSTDRKRGAIGILRVMGMSGPGVFYLVLLRATVIGVMAGGLSVAAGHLIAIGLAWTPPPGSKLVAWKPVVSLLIQIDTIGVVLVGALLCCAVGSLIPAWWASRLDPFDAIVEGRFH